jgi:glycosyltransferase involved in cell wall biosynthesis
LKRLVEDKVEGVLYDSRDPRGLDRALQQLADAGVRARMSAAARARVVKDFSWGAHCAVLDRRLRAVIRRR